jgi:hypothetical protein
MHILTIRSKKLKQDFEFVQKGLYLYCNDYQICHGGGYQGSTMWCAKGDTQMAEKMCRSWYKQMMIRQITIGL